jgi:hypothetical protein
MMTRRGLLRRCFVAIFFAGVITLSVAGGTKRIFAVTARASSPHSPDKRRYTFSFGTKRIFAMTKNRQTVIRYCDCEERSRKILISHFFARLMSEYIDINF